MIALSNSLVHFLFFFSFVAMLRTTLSLAMRDTLFDVPVSNHGARVRMLIKAKSIGDKVELKAPDAVGGLKSPSYLALNPQGKMPLLVTGDGDYPIVESDTISRYILNKYTSSPTFEPKHVMQRTLSDQICRLHDIYITPVQGGMYKAKGFIYGSFGTDRNAALAELKRQLLNIESTLQRFETSYPKLVGNYLCGDEISLADATLFPTMVFCYKMLPPYFSWKEEDFTGPVMRKWWRFINTQEVCAQEVKQEIEAAINKWADSGRFDPIMDEMKQMVV